MCIHVVAISATRTSCVKCLTILWSHDDSSINLVLSAYTISVVTLRVGNNLRQHLCRSHDKHTHTTYKSPDYAKHSHHPLCIYHVLLVLVTGMACLVYVWYCQDSNTVCLQDASLQPVIHTEEKLFNEISSSLSFTPSLLHCHHIISSHPSLSSSVTLSLLLLSSSILSPTSLPSFPHLSLLLPFPSLPFPLSPPTYLDMFPTW